MCVCGAGGESCRFSILCPLFSPPSLTWLLPLLDLVASCRTRDEEGEVEGWCRVVEGVEVEACEVGGRMGGVCQEGEASTGGGGGAEARAPPQTCRASRGAHRHLGRI